MNDRRHSPSLPEISNEWQKSPLNQTGAPLSERTFFNHRDAIFDIFGIEIKNDRTLGFYIASSDMDGDSTAQWMLHTLCLNNVLQENADMKNRILVEKAPQEFDAEEYFNNYFGPIVDDGIEVTDLNYSV